MHYVRHYRHYDVWEGGGLDQWRGGQGATVTIFRGTKIRNCQWQCEIFYKICNGCMIRFENDLEYF